MPASILDLPLAFVDVETTGTSYKHGGVIDVGIVRVEDGQVIQMYEQLVNPGASIPAFITQLTGITNDQLADAPTFADVWRDVYDLLDGCIFIAHNVRFDYAFIKEEFRRVGQSYSPKQLCTVKLSRDLYPRHRSHKLASLIERFDLQPDVRHRALADAQVTWQALQKMVEQKGRQTVEAAAKIQLRRPSLPAGLPQAMIEGLPEEPGVYIFEGESGATLYVGKSVNIKQRVLSHFADDHRITKELRMAQEITHIRTIPTSGELTALLEESRLIKELMPIHNQMLRRKSELVLAVLGRDKNGYPTVALQRGLDISSLVDSSQLTVDGQLSSHEPPSITQSAVNRQLPTVNDTIQLDRVLAVYKSTRQAKESLIALAKEYHLCHKLLGLQKTTGACFMHQLKVCQGACVGKESALEYQLRVTQAFAKTRLQQWPYQSPVLVTESASADQSVGLMIDQWCVVGQIEQRDQQVSVTATEPTFDLDHYKILKQYLSNPKNRSHIKILQPSEAQRLFQQQLQE